MKRTIACLLATLLLIYSVGAYAGDLGTMNKAQETVAAYSMLVGEGNSLEFEKMENYDEINSRYVFINYKDFGYDLVAMIRISEAEMYAWGFDLTNEELIKAKLIFDEDAPSCFILNFVDGEAVDSAVYIKGEVPYNAFLEDVDRIISSLSSGELNKQTGSKDPFLSIFPGIEWGMTKEKVFDLLGNEQFTHWTTESNSIITTESNIDGTQFTIMFLLNENGKLNMINVVGFNHDDKSVVVDYMLKLMKTYETPIITNYSDAMLYGKMGNLKEDKNGDCFVWTTDKSLIILSTGGSLLYQPLY